MIQKIVRQNRPPRRLEKTARKKVHLLQKKLIQQTTAQLKIRRLVQIHKQVRQKPIHLTAIMPCQHGMS